MTTTIETHPIQSSRKILRRTLSNLRAHNLTPIWYLTS